MKEIAKLTPEPLPSASMILTPQQTHYFYDEEHTAHPRYATTGVNQGDPLSGVMFMIGMVPVLKDAIHMTPHPNGTSHAA